MLVDNSIYKNVYKGNGITTDFPISFPFLDSAHIQVLRSPDGVNEEVVPSTEYTITGAGVENGGTCIFKVAPPTGIAIAVMRNVPITQLYAYRELDNFPAESHENALAKLTMICQQLSERLARAVTVGATEAMTPEELRQAFFNMFNEIIEADERIHIALGNLFAQVIEPFTTQDNVFDYDVGEDIVLDPDANNLLLSLGGVVQEPDASYTITGKNTIHFNSNPGDGIRCWGISCLSFSNPDIRAVVEKAITKIQAEGDKQAARAEKFADAAEASASSAASDAADVAANKAHVDTVAGEVKNLKANATTLDAGRPATASYDAETGTLEFGIPKGDAGDSAIMTGATATLPGAKGVVPAPTAGQQNKPLRGDGQWADFLDCMVTSIKGTDGTAIDAAKLLDIVSSYLPLIGGVLTGTISCPGFAIKQTQDDSALILSGGSTFDDGHGKLSLYGKDHPDTPGDARIDTKNNYYCFKDTSIYRGSDFSIFNSDIDIQNIPLHTVMYAPEGGAWKYARIQAASGGQAAISVISVPGGGALNAANQNFQVVIGVRTSL